MSDAAGPGSARSRPVPMSSSQLLIWAFEKLGHGPAAYHMPLGLQLTGQLDVGALRSALRELQSRHEGLRTCFADADGRGVQLPEGAPLLDLEYVDLSGFSEDEQAARVEALKSELGSRALPLSTGPLMHTIVARLRPDEHVLLLILHHIVADGWSGSILLSDLAAIYTALRTGRAHGLPPLEARFADYALWQQKRQKNGAHERSLAYWSRRLKDVPPSTELPTDRPRIPMQAIEGGSMSVALSPGLRDALDAFCRSHGTTRYSTLWAAFAVLLWRWSGQRDVAVGTPVACRNHPAFLNVVGFFSNVLVMRATLDPRQRFRDVLVQARRHVAEALCHQECPLEAVVQRVRPERAPGRNPIFQMSFSLQSFPRRPVYFAGLVARQIRFERPSVPLEIEFQLVDTGSALEVSVDFAATLFEHSTIARLISAYETLLTAAITDPDAHVADLPLLTAAERRDWARSHGASLSLPDEPCLHELFEMQAARTPDAIALRFEGEQLTYRELDCRANQLARHLRARHVGPETRVGVFLERSLSTFVSLLAIVKAGGAYVPLDPEFPAARLRAMTEDAGLRLILSHSDVAERLPRFEGEVLRLDAEADAIAQHPAGRLAVRVHPDNLLYCLFTSGSTGRPKAVMNAHRGVVNHLLWMQRECPIGLGDAMLQKTALTFDVSVCEIFWPLLNGARLSIVRPGGHRDPFHVAELVAAERITTLHFVPSMLQVFLPALARAGATSLRRVVCNGEEMTPALQERFQQALPDATLYNVYGPTEAAIAVSGWRCRPAPRVSKVPIGYAIANTALYVLNAALQPLPPGVIGELYIAGVQVGRGYLGRPGLTAERFLADPFAPVAGARMYRTGDLAKVRADGAIEFHGRADRQVKINGFRIEPGEIEAALEQDEHVRACAVIVARDADGRGELIAFVSTDESGTAGIRTRLRELLPAHMIPQRLVVLDTFPTTASGKIDRCALQPLIPTLSAEHHPSAAPLEGEHQAWLGRVWCSVLNLETVHADDNFFALGGDSLRAIEVVQRIQEEFEVELSPLALFEDQSIAALATRLQAHLAEANELVQPA